MSAIYVLSHPDENDLNAPILDQLFLRFGNAVAANTAALPPLGGDPIAAAIGSAQLVIVLIGPLWWLEQAATGRPWFADPGYPLTRALTLAYQQRKRILPVLVGGAVFPPTPSLPAIIQPLTQINASQVRAGPDFADDIERLIQSIRGFGIIGPTFTPVARSSQRDPQIRPIYVSYDPDDTSGSARRLIEQLTLIFGSANVVHDLALNAPGAVLAEEIARRIRASSLVLLVIGPRWAEQMRQPTTAAAHTMTLDIQTALQVGTPLVPVLVDGAARLDTATLPSTLQPLAAIQPAAIRPAGFFSSDLQGVIASLQPRIRRLPLTRRRVGRRLLIVAAIYLTLLACGGAFLYQALRNGSLSSLTYPKLNSVVMVSPDEGWAVGAAAYGGGVLLHDVKGKWTLENIDKAGDLHGIIVAPDKTLWATGDYGTFLHYANGAWKILSKSSNFFDSGESIAAPAQDNVWIVGKDITQYRNGQLTSRAISFGSSSQLNGLAFLSADEGWAVGNQGLIFHYKQGTWSSLPTPTAFALNGVAVLPSGEAWAVGDGGTLLHEVGGAWTQVTSGTNADLNGIALAADGSTGWIVGGGGTVLRWQNGSWQVAPSVGTDDLHGVTLASRGEAWAVGDYTIAHAVNGVWTTNKPPQLPQ